MHNLHVCTYTDISLGVHCVDFFFLFFHSYTALDVDGDSSKQANADPDEIMKQCKAFHDALEPWQKRRMTTFIRSIGSSAVVAGLLRIKIAVVY